MQCFLILSYVKVLFFLNKLSKNVDFVIILFIYDYLKNILVIIPESLVKYYPALVREFSFIIINIIIVIIITIMVIIIIE